MGYQDREYYQEDSHSGYQLGGELSYTWRLVILYSGLFLANMFLFAPQSDDLTSVLALRGDTLVQPLYWWQVLTYGFMYDAHPPGDQGGGLQPLFWNMIGLVCFGGAVESTLGKREFLRFYLISILLGGLVWATRVFFVHGGQSGDENVLKELHAAQLMGAGGAVTAVSLLYCIKYPFNIINVMFVLPVPAWVIGLLIIVGNVFQAGQLMQPPGSEIMIVGHDIHVVGALFAIGYYYFDWNLTRTFSFRWASSLAKGMGKLVKARPKLKVYDAEADEESKYRELETEADRILEKIGRDGEGSLTKKERDLLERYSRLMRQKHR